MANPPAPARTRMPRPVTGAGACFLWLRVGAVLSLLGRRVMFVLEGLSCLLPACDFGLGKLGSLKLQVWLPVLGLLWAHRTMSFVAW